MKVPCLLAASLVLACLLASCEDMANEFHPKFSHEVAFEPDQLSLPMTMGLQSEIKVILPGPEPNSGYEWAIVANNGRVLKQSSPVRFTAFTHPHGQAGVSTVTFYSLRPGKSSLTFMLIRSGERDCVPIERHVIRVIVND